MVKRLLLSVAVLVFVEAIAGYLFLSLGLMPANADSRPSAFERWASRKSLRATIKKSVSSAPNPVAPMDANVIEGVHLYAMHCAVCHGASDGKPSAIASGLFQRAPQLARHGVEDDPAGEVYWKIAHGIRFTGMPSFGKSLSDEDIWKVTLFLQTMDQLSPEAKKAWEAVPSAAIGITSSPSVKAN